MGESLQNSNGDQMNQTNLSNNADQAAQKDFA